MKLKLIIAWLFCAISAYSQVGVVTDKDKIPLPGVNIVIQNTSTGVVTDVNGKFTIEADIGKIIIVSYMGYKTIEVKVTENMKIVLGRRHYGALKQLSLLVTPQSLRRELQVLS